MPSTWRIKKAIRRPVDNVALPKHFLDDEKDALGNPASISVESNGRAGAAATFTPPTEFADADVVEVGNEAHDKKLFKAMKTGGEIVIELRTITKPTKVQRERFIVQGFTLGLGIGGAAVYLLMRFAL